MSVSDRGQTDRTKWTKRAAPPTRAGTSKKHYIWSNHVTADPEPVQDTMHECVIL